MTLVKIYIHRFKSNYLGGGLGFQAEYNALDSMPQCGGNYTNGSGLLTSPSYPNPYSHNADCLYIISEQNIAYVNFTLLLMDIECKADYIQIWDGLSNNSILIGSWCGNGSGIPAFIPVTQNSLRIG